MYQDQERNPTVTHTRKRKPHSGTSPRSAVDPAVGRVVGARRRRGESKRPFYVHWKKFGPSATTTRESSNEGRVRQGPQYSGVPWITPEDPWAKRRKVNDQRARDKLEKSLTRNWRSAQRRGKAKARGTIGGKRTLGRSGKGKQSIRDGPFLG